MSAYFTNSLTSPACLGLLALPAGGFSFGRAARGSVAPRKMACRPPAGRNNSGSRPSTRAQEEGQPGRCPFLIGKREWPIKRATLFCSHDWSGRFPLIAQAANALRVRSFLIDGEAVACDGDGMPSFDRLRYRRADGHVFLFAFDLIELNGSSNELTRRAVRW
jgi:hypothetical protein